MTETTERLRMAQSKKFRYFRRTLKDGENVYHSPTEITEMTERLRMALSKHFRPFCYFRGTSKDGVSDTIVPQKGQKQQKFSA